MHYQVPRLSRKQTNHAVLSSCETKILRPNVERNIQDVVKGHLRNSYIYSSTEKISLLHTSPWRKNIEKR